MRIFLNDEWHHIFILANARCYAFPCHKQAVFVNRIDDGSLNGDLLGYCYDHSQYFIQEDCDVVVAVI